MNQLVIKSGLAALAIATVAANAGAQDMQRHAAIYSVHAAPNLVVDASVFQGLRDSFYQELSLGGMSANGQGNLLGSDTVQSFASRFPNTATIDVTLKAVDVHKTNFLLASWAEVRVQEDVTAYGPDGSVLGAMSGEGKSKRLIMQLGSLPLPLPIPTQWSPLGGILGGVGSGGPNALNDMARTASVFAFRDATKYMPGMLSQWALNAPAAQPAPQQPVPASPAPPALSVQKLQISGWANLTAAYNFVNALQSIKDALGVENVKMNSFSNGVLIAEISYDPSKISDMIALLSSQQVSALAHIAIDALAPGEIDGHIAA